MSSNMLADAAKGFVRWNTEKVQSRGNFAVFKEPFADDFVDYISQPNISPDKDGVRSLYRRLRAASWPSAASYTLSSSPPKLPSE